MFAAGIETLHDFYNTVGYLFPAVQILQNCFLQHSVSEKCEQSFYRALLPITFKVAHLQVILAGTLTGVQDAKF